MTTTQEQLINATPQTRVVAVAKPAVHLGYLDTIRVILIVLVIALHTAITYGADGDWTYVDPMQNEITSIVLTFVTGIVQSFSLGLYFFISGYFTPGSYDRKGAVRFWKDRLLKLAVPMLVYTFLLSRIPQFVAGRAEGGITDSFWQFSKRTLKTGADEGPTWFIFALLLFLIGYTIWRLATSSTKPDQLAWTKKLNAPGKKQILLFGLVVAVLMFVVGLKSGVGETIEVFGIFNLMTIFFVQYILFFIVGILAYRNDWLNRFNGKDLRFWAWLSLGMILLMPVLFAVVLITGGSPDMFMGGLNFAAAAFMLWVGLFSVSISMTLILWLRDRKQPRSKLMEFAGHNSYGVYLIHPIILIPVSVLLTPVLLPPMVKYVIVLPLVVVLCFLAAEGLRRLPGFKAVL